MSDFAISSRAGVLYWQGEERYIQGKEGGLSWNWNDGD